MKAINSHFIHKNHAVFGLLLFMLVACAKDSGPDVPVLPPPAIEAQITILAAEKHQLIRGFGCASAFAPPSTTPMTAEEIARLFGKGNGQVGLNFLRIRIGTDNAWRNTELGYAKEALKHNAKIFASPWSPPAAMKTNGSLIKGKLKADSASAYAKYLNDFALYMQANGAPLYAISVQNEPDWEPDYEGCVWTATEMRDFIKQHGAAITATKLVAPELVNNNASFVNTIVSDDAAMANLAIIASHIYGGGIVGNPAVTARNKEYWMTEHLDTAITHVAALGTATEIHNCLTKANFNAYFWWYGKRFYGVIGQDGQVTKRGYFMSHFARFIPEGATRLGSSANSNGLVLISAYEYNGKKIVIAINTGTAVVNQRITISGAAAGGFLPFVTSETKNVEQGATINAAAGSFSFNLPALSVVSFVEQ